MKANQSLPAIVAAFLLAAAPGVARSQTPPAGLSPQAANARGAVAGRVMGASNPLGAAAVYAYQVVDRKLQKVATDVQGNFRFDQLPAGVYNIIAHRIGFVPAVVRLTRSTAEAYQFLEIQLARQTAGAAGAGGQAADFWSIRSKIPADVLRDIQGMSLASAAQPDRTTGIAAGDFADFKTEVGALSGVDSSLEGAQSQMKGGQVDVEGRLGKLQVGLTGKLLQLASDTANTQTYTDGEVRALSLAVGTGSTNQISVTSLTNRLNNRPGSGDLSPGRDDSGSPVDFENYRVSWSQEHGKNGRSDFAAQYTNESNYHRVGLFDPPDIPEASRAWLFEGSYTAALGDSGTIQAGVRYRERQSELVGFGRSAELDQANRANVDVFGQGGVRISPAVLVEYGMFSTLRDGSVALTPKGGVVVQLGSAWQAETSFSRRVFQNNQDLRTDFLPVLMRSADFCEQGGESCYSLTFSRKKGDDEKISLGAAQRTITETSRLYFSEDLLDRQESLYLVRGDRVPEVQFELQHRLSPRIVSKLSSSVASGGGGIFYATDRKHYENRLTYAVTSLDTQFQATETGVFLAFHKLSQDLEPVKRSARSGGSEAEFEKLRLVVSQNLNVLVDLGTDWIVRLDLEVSRGSEVANQAGASSARGDDELRKRFVGGFAVRF
ncbi:MAG TPA: carboxypeptidase-like regulatory domain-containing protein [Thermoanaerobaculia bacterium]|nr:carboxypeptidase-like regulatory domain-containing protein [Thermoanaerobaculia bacterium]